MHAVFGVNMKHDAGILCGGTELHADFTAGLKRNSPAADDTAKSGLGHDNLLNARRNIPSRLSPVEPGVYTPERLTAERNLSFPARSRPVRISFQYASGHTARRASP